MAILIVQKCNVGGSVCRRSVVNILCLLHWCHIGPLFATLGTQIAIGVNKKDELSLRWPLDAPYVWVPRSIFTLFRDITAFVLQHATFPTPLLVSPKFPHVPLEYFDGFWATKSDGVGLMVRAISFQDFQPMWSWSTNVTDRPRDRRHAIARPRFALLCIAR